MSGLAAWYRCRNCESTFYGTADPHRSVYCNDCLERMKIAYTEEAVKMRPLQWAAGAFLLICLVTFILKLVVSYGDKY